MEVFIVNSKSVVLHKVINGWKPQTIVIEYRSTWYFFLYQCHCCVRFKHHGVVDLPKYLVIAIQIHDQDIRRAIDKLINIFAVNKIALAKMFYIIKMKGINESKTQDEITLCRPLSILTI